MGVEIVEDVLLLLKLQRIARFAESFIALGFRKVDDLWISGNHFPGEVVDVFTLIPTLRYLGSKGTSFDRLSELVHLDATIIDIELAGRGCTGSF